VNVANQGTFGEELDDYLMDSKIVLNLLAFDDDTEWKMTRFLKPLANRRCVLRSRETSGRLHLTPGYGRLVISERSGSSAEQQLFASGVVFVERHEIVEACQYYLAHPEELRLRAEEAYRAFTALPEEKILADLEDVQELLARKDGTVHVSQLGCSGL
jgi:hypothetical protein